MMDCDIGWSQTLMSDRLCQFPHKQKSPTSCHETSILRGWGSDPADPWVIKSHRSSSYRHKDGPEKSLGGKMPRG